MVNYMRRKLLCGLAMACLACGMARTASAQPVPARDLWDFPLGAVGAPAALSTEAGVGLWNPAMMALPDSMRWRAGVASLSTGVDQGVEAQLLGLSIRRSSGTFVGFSLARSAVTGLVRTDTDPQGLGTLRYESWLGSLAMSRPVTSWLSVGAAARWRLGHADEDVRNALAADLGFVARYAPWRDARLAVGTFLWRPGREAEDRPLVTMAADFRVVGSGPLSEARVGLAAQEPMRGQTSRSTGEFGPFASARLGPLEARAAIPTLRASGEQLTRARFSVSLHLARFVVGIGREDASVGLGPLYQFSFSAFGQ